MAQIFYGEVTTESVIVFILLLFGAFLIGNLIYLILRRLTWNKLTPALSKVVSRLVTYAIYVVALYIGFSKILGLNLSAAIAAVGIAGILIAISSQQILQNIFAGVIIAMERPINIGDWVEVGGFPQAGICRVRDITLLRTSLRSINGNIVFVSNSTLVTANIINYTRGKFLRVPVTFSVPLSANLEKIKKIVLEICKKHEKILPNVPKKEQSTILKFVKIPSLKKILESPTEYSYFQPVVNLKEISDSSIVLETSVWIWEINNKDAIVSDLLQKIIGEFKRNKIDFA